MSKLLGLGRLVVSVFADGAIVILIVAAVLFRVVSMLFEFVPEKLLNLAARIAKEQAKRPRCGCRSYLVIVYTSRLEKPHNGLAERRCKDEVVWCLSCGRKKYTPLVKV